MTTRIEVTAEDIRKARRPRAESYCSTCCPIALAGRRAFGMSCSVTGSTLRIHDGIRSSSRIFQNWDLPTEAEQFVADFDHAGKKAVQPFSFEL